MGKLFNIFFKKKEIASEHSQYPDSFVYQGNYVLLPNEVNVGNFKIKEPILLLVYTNYKYSIIESDNVQLSLLFEYKPKIKSYIGLYISELECLISILRKDKSSESVIVQNLLACLTFKRKS